MEMDHGPDRGFAVVKHLSRNGVHRLAASGARSGQQQNGNRQKPDRATQEVRLNHGNAIRKGKEEDNNKNGLKKKKVQIVKDTGKKHEAAQPALGVAQALTLRRYTASKTR
jgi:hypothetical protein